jgi:alginate O-acetyltransferase complex protein AlgI
MQGLLVVWDDLGIVGVKNDHEDGSSKKPRYLLRSGSMVLLSRI